MNKYETGYEHEYYPDFPEEEEVFERPIKHNEPEIIREITGPEADDPFPDIPVPEMPEEDSITEILIGNDRQIEGQPSGIRIQISSLGHDFVPEVEPEPRPANPEKDFQDDLEEIAKQYKARIP